MIRPETPQNLTPQRNFHIKTTRVAGLLVHPYALELYRAKHVTDRGMILLSLVDYFLKPYRDRIAQQEDWPLEWVNAPQSICFTFRYLQERLRCNAKTVRATIDAVCSLRPAVLKARRVGRNKQRWWWEFKTRSDPATQETAVKYNFCPAAAVLAFQSGKITAREMIVVGMVRGLSRKRRCNATNAFFAKQLGIAPGTAANAVIKLVRAGILEAEYKTAGYLKTRRYLAIAPGWLEDVNRSEPRGRVGVEKVDEEWDEE